MPSNYAVEIQINARKPRVSAARVKKNTAALLKALGWKTAALSLLLVSDRRIRTLNKQYLRHDRPTDVIAFSQLEGKPLGPKDRKPFLGDIVISLETAARQAEAFGNTFDYELHFYICHGILHLMGWDDKKKSEANRMNLKQQKLLEKIGVLRT